MRTSTRWLSPFEGPLPKRRLNFAALDHLTLHNSPISSLRPGAAMAVPSVTAPARVLASAGMMDTRGPRLLEGEQDGVNRSATS